MRDGTTVDPSHHRGWLVCGFFVFLCCLADLVVVVSRICNDVIHVAHQSGMLLFVKRVACPPALLAFCSLTCRN